MKISYNWLVEYVAVKNSAKMAAQWLTMAGLEVTSIEEKGKDSVLDVEVTTNRPDWLSVIGVARELSAITGKRFKPPKVPSILPITIRDKTIKVEIQDKLLCPRYSARIIDGVSVGPSPQWLKDHLEAIGVRPVNNVVDITNFCLFELGQPLHAFDYDKLTGNTIIVRKAKQSEKILTIDGSEKELESGMLVIADEKKPVAVAGIMGGLDTEVTERTRTVLLESACFDPVSVRQTQRKLGISSDSSYRFEREVDIEGVLFASNRAAKLIAENCGGKIGVLKDIGVKVAKPVVIRLSMDKLNKILNLDMAAIAAKKILESLGLKVGAVTATLRVEIPSFRRDLRREEDLIEEIARIYNYDNIPVTIPRMVGHSDRVGLQRRIESLTKDILCAEGLDEVVNYSLIDTKDFKNGPLVGDENLISIKNPLSNQQEIMRPSLVYGVLSCARFNINRRTKEIGIYELSRVYYQPKHMEFKERSNLCLLLSGQIKKSWRQKAEVDFFEIKGIVETLFNKLGIEEYDFIGNGPDLFYPANVAKIVVGGNNVGVIGEVRKDILERFDIKKPVFLCEIEFDELIKSVTIEKKYRPLPKFLSVERDISLVVAKDVSIKDLLRVARKQGGEIVRKADLSDEYFGKQIPSGKRGLTISLEYLSEKKQLTESDIEKVHSRVKDALITRFSATIR